MTLIIMNKNACSLWDTLNEKFNYPLIETNIKKYYHKDIDDPLLYHSTINTNLLLFDIIAEIIDQLVVKRFPKMFE
ncbi:MAG: hypothetical protein GXO85_17250 [Chlorobi bacterium]|nr:hypothetical protein [Chlorobiota bacterium]